MPVSFSGFPPALLEFLRELKENNEREWFEANRERYERDVKAPMLEAIAELNRVLLEVVPDYVTAPKKALFRIHRDVRFSKDKSPYKTNVAAQFFRQNLGKGESAGFYLHLDTEELFIGGGCYLPPPEHLRVLRQHIAENPERFRALVEDKKRKKVVGELYGEPGARVPKGFAADHPAAEYLRHKMYVYAVTLPAQEAESPKVLKTVGKVFAAIAPFLEFLNEPMARRAAKARQNYFL
ncbi:MAG: DUF2461 domain-containing protein [Bryobacter sp.]|nr:DUF2461 domain-containing protein [Bryobacter sp.]